jgi:hypothetical protein
MNKETKKAVWKLRNDILTNVFQNDIYAMGSAAGKLHGIEDDYDWHQKLESIIRDYQREMALEKTTKILEKKYAQH